MAGGNASDFLLDDMIYADVRNGWNHKLHSTSQQLSGLIPFVELYAVFDRDDIIFKHHGLAGPKFSDISDRAIDVKFQYTTGTRVSDDGTIYSTNNEPFDFDDRFQVSQNSKIVPIASTAKSQTEPESLTYNPSYEGHAGVVDLAVSRGASGPLNVKYDLNLTIPNPELINDLYEYSKLMILNSTFLLSYGWHPHDMDYPSGPTPLSRISRSSHDNAQMARTIPENIIELNGANGGFYKTTLIRLYQFSFNLDNVGHLSGKLSFLTLAGNYLVSTKTQAISSTISKLLDGYSGMLMSDSHTNENRLADAGQEAAAVAEQYIQLGLESLEQTQNYISDWQTSIEYRKEKWALNRGRHPTEGQQSGKEYLVEEHLESKGYAPFEDTNAEQDTISQLSGVTKVPGVNMPLRWSSETTEEQMRLFEPADWPFGGDANAAVGKMFGMWVDTKPMEDRPDSLWGYEGWWERLPMYEVMVPQPAASFDSIDEGLKNQLIEEWSELISIDPRGERTNGQLLEEAKEAKEKAVFGNTADEEDSVEDDDLEIEALREEYGLESSYDVRDLARSRQLYFTQRIREISNAGGLSITPNNSKNIQIAREDGKTLNDAGKRPHTHLKTIPYLNWLIDKYSHEQANTLGFLKIENGLPWVTPDKLAAAGLLDNLDYTEEEMKKLTMLDTMPSYGKELMRLIWNDFAKPGNPNRSRFFPVNPDKTTRDFLGKRTVKIESAGYPETQAVDFLDPDTVKILKSSCAISTMLLDVLPPPEEGEDPSSFDRQVAELMEDVGDGVASVMDFLSGGYESVRDMAVDYGLADDDSPAGIDRELERRERDLQDLASLQDLEITSPLHNPVNLMKNTLKSLAIHETTQAEVEAASGMPNDSPEGTEIESAPVRFSTHSKPVYYFLGAVLEALRLSMRDKIKFVYRDIPLEGDMSPSGFSLPMPEVNAQKMKSSGEVIKKIDEERKAFLARKREAMRLVISPSKYNDDGSEDTQLPYPHVDAGPMRQARNNALPRNQGPDELEPLTSKNKYGRRVRDGTRKLTDSPADEEFTKNRSNEWSVDSMEPDQRGAPMTKKEMAAEEMAMQEYIFNLQTTHNFMVKQNESVFTHIQCKNVFELPVEISAVRAILNEGNAPLHSMVGKILKACEKTTKVMRLSSRTHPADESYLEVFVANIRVDGVTTEVFENLNINNFLSNPDLINNYGRYGLTKEQVNLVKSIPPEGYSSSDIAAARTLAMGAYFSNRAVVCEFGTERSLVESFSLSSKVDPNAFSSFRLPEVVGGQTVDVSKIVRGNLLNTSLGLMDDMRKIIGDGMLTGIEDLQSLRIVDVTGDRVVVLTDNLKNFLLTSTQSASKAQTSFITQLMAHSQDFNTKIMSLQNAGLTGAGGKANSAKNNAFYGGVLSSYLRSISLTIHGTVGLGMFNVVYIKGLMRGIEGLYLITSVNEALTPGNFVTTLECKLIEYKDTSAMNPLASGPSLTQAAEYQRGLEEELANGGVAEYNTTYAALFSETEKNIEATNNQSIITASQEEE